MPSGSGFDWDVRKANGKSVYKDTSKHLNEKDTLCIGVVALMGWVSFIRLRFAIRTHWVNHYAKGGIETARNEVKDPGMPFACTSGWR